MTFFFSHLPSLFFLPCFPFFIFDNFLTHAVFLIWLRIAGRHLREKPFALKADRNEALFESFVWGRLNSLQTYLCSVYLERGVNNAIERLTWWYKIWVALLKVIFLKVGAPFFKTWVSVQMDLTFLSSLLWGGDVCGPIYGVQGLVLSYNDQPRQSEVSPSQ